MTVESFSEQQIDQVARVLEGAVTHTQLIDLFRQSGIEMQGGNPKWERIKLALVVRQSRDRCGNNVANFVQVVLDPVRFVGKDAKFEDLRHRLNEVLAFASLHLGENGKLRPAAVANTLERRTFAWRTDRGKRGLAPGPRDLAPGRPVAGCLSPFSGLRYEVACPRSRALCECSAL